MASKAARAVYASRAPAGGVRSVVQTPSRITGDPGAFTRDSSGRLQQFRSTPQAEFNVPRPETPGGPITQTITTTTAVQGAPPKPAAQAPKSDIAGTIAGVNVSQRYADLVAMRRGEAFSQQNLLSVLKRRQAKGLSTTAPLTKSGTEEFKKQRSAQTRTLRQFDESRQNIRANITYAQSEIYPESTFFGRVKTAVTSPIKTFNYVTQEINQLVSPITKRAPGYKQAQSEIYRLNEDIEGLSRRINELGGESKLRGKDRFLLLKRQGKKLERGYQRAELTVFEEPGGFVTSFGAGFAVEKVLSGAVIPAVTRYGPRVIKAVSPAAEKALELGSKGLRRISPFTEEIISKVSRRSYEKIVGITGSQVETAVLVGTVGYEGVSVARSQDPGREAARALINLGGFVSGAKTGSRIRSPGLRNVEIVETRSEIAGFERKGTSAGIGKVRIEARLEGYAPRIFEGDVKFRTQPAKGSLLPPARAEVEAQTVRAREIPFAKTTEISPIVDFAPRSRVVDVTARRVPQEEIISKAGRSFILKDVEGLRPASPNEFLSGFEARLSRIGPKGKITQEGLIKGFGKIESDILGRGSFGEFSAQRFSAQGKKAGRRQFIDISSRIVIQEPPDLLGVRRSTSQFAGRVKQRSLLRGDFVDQSYFGGVSKTESVRRVKTGIKEREIALAEISPLKYRLYMGRELSQVSVKYRAFRQTAMSGSFDKAIFEAGSALRDPIGPRSRRAPIFPDSERFGGYLEGRKREPRLLLEGPQQKSTIIPTTLARQTGNVRFREQGLGSQSLILDEQISFQAPKTAPRQRRISPRTPNLYGPEMEFVAGELRSTALRSFSLRERIGSFIKPARGGVSLRALDIGLGGRSSQSYSPISRVRAESIPAISQRSEILIDQIPDAIQTTRPITDIVPRLNTEIIPRLTPRVPSRTTQELITRETFFFEGGADITIPRIPEGRLPIFNPGFPTFPRGGSGRRGGSRFRFGYVPDLVGLIAAQSGRYFKRTPGTNALGIRSPTREQARILGLPGPRKSRKRRLNR